MDPASEKKPNPSEVRFGPFFLDIPSRRLRHNAAIVPLTPKAAELLALMASKHGSPVARDEIMDTLWRGDKATDYALSQTVHRLRRAIAAFDSTTEYIRTVPGYGFHLVTNVMMESPAESLTFSDPAFRSYQEAMFKLRQLTQPKLLDSIRSFEESLALNPTFVPALVGLAQVYTNAGIRSFIDPIDAYYRARKALSRAVALDPSNADAFATLSLLLLFFDTDLGGARDAAEQAVSLAPQSARVRSAMVWQLLARQDFGAALTEADRALRMSPSNAHVSAMLGIALYFGRRYDEARSYFMRSLNFLPDYAPALFYHACSDFMTYDYGRALSFLDRISGTEMSPRELAVRGCIAIRCGRADAASDYLAELAALPFRADVSIASIHINDGDLDRATAVLTEALKTREPALFAPTIDPFYEPLVASHPLLISTIRKGRPKSCDRCAAPFAHQHISARPLYELALCDSCAGSADRDDLLIFDAGRP